jgi:hypothetical protein
MIDGQSGNSARRNMTFVIRAFVSEDGVHYGVLSDPGAANRWQANFSGIGELVALVQDRLDSTPTAGRDHSPGDPGLQQDRAHPLPGD